MHWTSPYRAPPKTQGLPQPAPPGHATSLYRWPLQVTAPWTWYLTAHVPPAPASQICSNLFIMKDVRLASERFASYWNAFLFDNAYKKSDVTQNSDRRADHLHVRHFKLKQNLQMSIVMFNDISIPNTYTNSKWQRMKGIPGIFATVSILSILSLVNQIL